VIPYRKTQPFILFLFPLLKFDCTHSAYGLGLKVLLRHRLYVTSLIFLRFVVSDVTNLIFFAMSSGETFATSS
jgi:hypothetical protein